MESGDDTVLRSRFRAIPKVPIFPELDGLDGECSQGERQQGNGDNHITSNGERILTPSSAGLRGRTLTSYYSDIWEAAYMLFQQLHPFS